MFLSKAFSMSELKIYQILKFNYYKKLQEWWTNDVYGDCVSFKLYRNTESSKKFLKRWRGDYKKEEYIYQQCFYLEESTQVECRSVKNKTTVEPMKQKLEIRNINSIAVLNLIQMQNPDLSEDLLIIYPNLIDFRLIILQYTKKKTIKTYILVISFFNGKK